MINTETELFFEPIKILNDMSDRCKSEMTEGQLAFVCGLIKTYRPKKIIEIGVAAGGTTSVVLNCLSMLDLDAQMFSIDLSTEYYRDQSKKTGYLIEECMTKLGNKTNHVLYTGKNAVEYLEQIGRGIDMVILDTVHRLPGELLDYLACYPFLKKDAIVVLHDIALNSDSGHGQAFATKLLFDTVVAEKYLQDCGDAFPNIGAFKVTEETGRYIDDVFSALTITWAYMPKEDELCLYKEFYKKYYTQEQINLFNAAVRLNQRGFDKNKKAKREEISTIFKEAFSWSGTVRDKRVYIYGCGDYGKRLHCLLGQVADIKLMGYIISDGQEKPISGDDVHYLTETHIEQGKDIIFVGVHASLQEEICARLQEKGITDYIIPSEGLFRVI